MNVDKILEEIEEELGDILYETPLFTVGNVLLWKTNQGFNIDLCETYPYAPDGDVPLVFFTFYYIEFMLESPRLYKWIYKKRYGEELGI